jgi:hypothetical protein
MARKILILQNSIRQWIAHRQFLTLRQSVLLIQRYCKSHREVKRFQMMCIGFTRLQTQFHTRMLTLRYSVLRSRILNIQRYCRGYLGKIKLQIFLCLSLFSFSSSKLQSKSQCNTYFTIGSSTSYCSKTNATFSY